MNRANGRVDYSFLIHLKGKDFNVLTKETGILLLNFETGYHVSLEKDKCSSVANTFENNKCEHRL